jgi:hypothetical protein
MQLHYSGSSSVTGATNNERKIVTRKEDAIGLNSLFHLWFKKSGCINGSSGKAGLELLLPLISQPQRVDQCRLFLYGAYRCAVDSRWLSSLPKKFTLLPPLSV